MRVIPAAAEPKPLTLPTAGDLRNGDTFTLTKDGAVYIRTSCTEPRCESGYIIGVTLGAGAVVEIPAVRSVYPVEVKAYVTSKWGKPKGWPEENDRARGEGK